MKRLIYIESLGCAKNTVDTENVLGLLDDDYDYAAELENADFLIVNTCAFIHDAEDESYEVIAQFCEYKKNAAKNSADDKKVIVMGCLAESASEKLLRDFEIDAIVGTGSFFRMPEVLKRLSSGESGFVIRDSVDIEIPDLPRIVTTPPHYAYLKIAEGCDNRCTYCLIPSLRGRYRSRDIDDIVREAEMLDVEELILIAQDTSRYGIDIYGAPALAALLEGLNAVENIRWIRVHYLYPDLLTDELIDKIFELDKVVKYFDIPVQHISDKILKLMNRKTSAADIQRVFDRVRAAEAASGIKAAIRTTFIVGFPGEEEEDFLKLRSFVMSNRIDRLGVFTYSDMPSVPSYKLGGKVDEEVAAERRDAIMEIQLERSTEFMEDFIGSEVEVIVDDYVEDESLYICRTSLDAPDVDGEVYVYSDKPVDIGCVLRARITHSSDYDLIGEFV